MAELKHVEISLRNFARRVVKAARGNLTLKKKNVTGGLRNSLKFQVKESPGTTTLEFEMSEFGAFQDQGVKGANPSLVKNGKQKAPNSIFKFRTKMPPQKPLEKWAKARGIRLRDEKGRFAKGSFKTIGFILQRRIFAQGIKPSLFFTRPFDKAFQTLPEPLLKALSEDLISTIKFKTDV